MPIEFSRNKLPFAIFLAIFLGVSCILTVLAIDITLSAGKDVFSSQLKMPAVDDIRCDEMEFTKFHIHTHLDIFVDGKPITVPSQIGIDPEGKCLYWLHTHDDTGIIHIESPVERKFMLGNFIDIWKQSFKNTQLFDNSTRSGTNNTLSVYVNGIKEPTGSNFRNTSINAHDEIALIFGPIEDSKIPKKYEFQQGL